FPLGRDVQVDGGKDLMLLLASGIEAADWTKRAVVFKSGVDFPGDGIRNFEVRSELETFLFSGPGQGAFQCGIEREIPASEILIDNRTNLPAPHIFGKLSSHEPDLLRKTNAYRPTPLWRYPKARPDVRADIIPSAAIARAGEDVKAGLEPIVEPMRDLDRLVPRVIRRQRATVGLLRALGSKVIMQLEHRDAAGNSFRTIDLNFVIVLSGGRTAGQADVSESEHEQKYRSRSQNVSSHECMISSAAFYNRFGMRRQW